jgi:hypothetical protein
VAGARVLQRVRAQGCARGPIKGRRKLGVRARGGRGKHGGGRGVRGKRIGPTAPRDTGSGGEGSREEGRRARSRARVRFRGADPDAEAQPAGRNREEGIGRWKEEERGGADMWARAGREGKGRGDATRSWPCGGGKWASVAHAGREEERGRAGLAKALGWFPSLFFSFLFSTLTPIQTNLIEFKIQFEFKPINSTQLK